MSNLKFCASLPEAKESRQSSEGENVSLKFCYYLTTNICRSTKINKLFSPHGSIDIVIDNGIVVMDIEGPCNKEFFKLMAEELFKVRELIDLDNYTGLVILHGEALAAEDAMAFFIDYLKSITPKAIALDLSNTESPSMTESLCKKAYVAAGIKHGFFMSTDEAKQWLRQQMS